MHTPGPWTATKHQASGVWMIDTTKEIRSGVVQQISQVGGHPDTKEANARLIAAAPELLEAVKRMAGDFHAGCPTHDMEKCTHALCLENSRLITHATG